MAIELGDRVRDKITGFKGIVTGITQWLYGCTRIVILKEKVERDGKAQEMCIDEPQAELIQKAVVKRAVPESAPAEERRHGPRQDPGRAPDPTR